MVFDATRKVTYDNLKIWYNEMRSHCPHIPVIIIANKIDLDPRTTKRSYKYIEDLKVPFNVVSAADGTNVVKIFRECLDLAIEYKANPPKDDFMAEVMNLLGDEKGVENNKYDDGNDESVQTNSLGENEDKDHTYEDVISLGIGSDTGITGNTNGKTSSKGRETASKTSTEVLVALHFGQ